MLIIFSGLPGTGKTTIARELARQLGAVLVRIDSIEHAIREFGTAVDDVGYRIAYAVAEDNLRIGRDVVADSVNPWPLTRSAWLGPARRAGVRAIDVEIICSDSAEHRRRVETRSTDIGGFRLPTWEEVVTHDYQPWDRDRLVIDTARLSVDESVTMLQEALRALG
jgi:predicted kinase